MAAPLPFLVSDPNGCLTLSKTRAHCGIRSTSKNTWNEIIRYLRSLVTERFADPIVSLPPDAFRKREPVHLRSAITGKIGSPVTIRQPHVSNLVGLAIERYGKLDVLVNNAGVAPISLLDELRVDDWEEMNDVNLKGVLCGIAAALPVFRRQSFGHFVNVISTAGLQIIPTMAVYAGTKNAVRTITETLRQEAGAKLRVTGISPGFVQTNLTTSMSDPGVKAQIAERMEKMAIPPAAIARAIAFAIEQPAEVDVNEIVIRPTAQT